MPGIFKSDKSIAFSIHCYWHISSNTVDVMGCSLSKLWSIESHSQQYFADVGNSVTQFFTAHYQPYMDMYLKIVYIIY